MQSALNREYRKMFRNLNGIRTMNRLPECMVVIDPKKEKNAVSEAQKMGVTTVALIDTDSDPDTGGSADSGQRRQHSFDRVGAAAIGRRGAGRQEPAATKASWPRRTATRSRRRLRRREAGRLREAWRWESERIRAGLQRRRGPSATAWQRSRNARRTFTPVRELPASACVAVP